MTYKETLDYLYSQLPIFQRIGAAAYKANLDNIIALDNHLKNPHKNYKTIHIAGTNGKGTTSHSIASVLQEAGYKVGLYTSPHLLDFRERIRVNGQMVSEDFVVDFVKNNKEIFEKIKPSFFEMTVAMAFEYFKQQQVDVAVIEVGLGGKLDSTNIITPILSIITNIGYDHQQFLGNDLISIATQKAGIIKPGIPVVVGENKPQIKAVFLNKAQELDCPIYFAQHNFAIESYFIQNNQLVLNIKSHFENAYENLIFDFSGLYQLQNILTILQALEVLKNKLNIPKESIYNGLKNVRKNTHLLGRWQIISENPFIICDIAHNIDGITAIHNQLKEMNYSQLHFILGVVSDKDIKSILKALPHNAKYYITQASIPRAMEAEKLFEKAQQTGLNCVLFKDVPTAIENAIENYKNNDLIIISGSAFVVADALQYFIHNNYIKL